MTVSAAVLSTPPAASGPRSVAAIITQPPTIAPRSAAEKTTRPHTSHPRSAVDRTSIPATMLYWQSHRDDSWSPLNNDEVCGLSAVAVNKRQDRYFV